jgi:hypothetical protein
MSIFSTILSKLGIKPAAAPAAAAPAAPAPTTFNHMDSRPIPSSFVPAPSAPVAPKPVAIPVVDVVTQLDGLAKKNPEKLDWKVSIVDLLKLLDLDSSLAARKELATELGCPADKIGGDYSQMNIWLHQTVLQKIADNGGNIPASLLHK